MKLCRVLTLIFLSSTMIGAMELEKFYPRTWGYSTHETNTAHQPLIKCFVWGTFIIQDAQGEEHVLCQTDAQRGDMRLWPNGHDRWVWSKTKTKHCPGVQPEDFKHLINDTIAYLILTRGVEGALKTNSRKLTEYLNTLKKEYPNLKVLKLLTPEAVGKYNSLVRLGKNVVGIFHATC